MMAHQPRMTPGVKLLLVALFTSFITQLSLSQFAGIPVLHLLGFSPQLFFHGAIWQLITYPFLHGGLSHILINALVLYMLGTELELRWGTSRFLKFFVVCAMGGALLQSLVWGGALLFSPDNAPALGQIPVIGASGAVYGLFMAFARLYGERQVLIFFILPMKARQFIIILVVVELVSAVFYSDKGIAHLVHLGGLATGFLYIWWKGNDLNGKGGGGQRRMSREEVKRRLSVVVDNERRQDKDGKYPITWN